MYNIHKKIVIECFEQSTFFLKFIGDTKLAIKLENCQNNDKALHLTQNIANSTC